MMSPRSTRHTVAAAIVAACLSAVAGGAVAHADDPTATADQQFAGAVTKLGIPTTPGQDLPAVGHKVCDMLNGGLAGAVNPVPVVRGVRDSLVQQGITRAQASGLLRAAVAIYCPENTQFVGR